MAVLDLGKLLAPVSEADPSGPNLEYDPAFAALEKAAEGKPEQAIGGVVSAGEPPEWGSVCDKALELLGRTKDLRVAVHLSRALLHREGVAGMVEGVALLRGLLDNHWATVHPQLDPEDDNDPTMRITALSALTTPAALLALRMAPLVESRALGPVSLADMAPPDTAPDLARIQGAFADTELSVLEACVGALASGSAHLRAIESVFAANGGGREPDLALLIQYFRQASQAVEPRVVERRAQEQVSRAPGDGEPGSSGASMAHARGLSGDILSREDVVRALDKISAYYRRHEPSSPVPLVVERCRKLVTMSFMEILTDLAPDGLKQAQLVTGKGDDK